MKKILQKIFLGILLSPLYLFANKDVWGQLEGHFTTQAEEATSSIASMISTFSATIGIIWIVIMMVIAKFQPERFKDNLKLLIGVTILLGIIYGISTALK
ncbi:hypothetical protein [Helicobacter winghamensis]|uniref:hypothetical protein n=1 Tax=Helicobacter winghamensis TaxID=157268 RepID=UPI0018A5598B|nr:hypothetical protein [Helicobacter winghamensis]QOQ98591.1 hypothetical protein A0Z60_03185 [Helicobacter winghamensis]